MHGILLCGVKRTDYLALGESLFYNNIRFVYNYILKIQLSSAINDLDDDLIWF